MLARALRPLLLAPAVLVPAALAVGVLLRRPADAPASPPEPAPAAAPATGPAGAAAPDPWTAPAAPTRWATRYTRFETFTREHGLPSERVTCVLSEPEGLVVGTEAGLALGRPGAFRVLGEAEGLPHPYVTAVARQPSTGDLWVGTLGGLARVAGPRVQVFTQTNSGLMNDVVYHVAVDGPLVWAATAAGASVYDVTSGTWALYDNRNAILHEPWCYALALAPGRVWIGVWGGGVVERDTRRGTWREYRDPDSEMEIDLLADDGPIHDVTSFLAYDEGLLWQTTYFGLSRFDGRAWRTWVARESGLPGDFLVHVAPRGRHAWISTDRGFAVFDGTTATVYRRRPDGTCALQVLRDGREVESAVLPTAPADDYVLGCLPLPTEVWLATGHGLSHGIAADGPAPAAGSGDAR